MTSPSVTVLPIKRGNSDTEPRVPVDTEAEFGEMLLQAQECQGLPVSPQKLGERLEQTSAHSPLRNQPADLLVLDFQPLRPVR